MTSMVWLVIKWNRLAFSFQLLAVSSDRLNPSNWPMGKKVYTTALWALTTCWITFTSAIYSADTAEISRKFHVSYKAANTGTSLLIFGFALRPMLWAPLCEVYGWKWLALAVRLPDYKVLCWRLRQSLWFDKWSGVIRYVSCWAEVET